MTGRRGEAESEHTTHHAGFWCANGHFYAFASFSSAPKELDDETRPRG